MRKKIKTLGLSCTVSLIFAFTQTVPIKASTNTDGMPDKINGVPVLTQYVTSRKAFRTSHSTNKYIVIHDTAATPSTADADNVRDYFNSGERYAGANFAVDDGKIVAIIPCTYSSYHCGDQGGGYLVKNDNSIGIELCVNKGSNWNNTMKNGEILTLWLMKKFNIPAENVVRHYDVTGKPCPERMLTQQLDSWPNFKKAIGGDARTTEPDVNKKGTVTQTSRLFQAPGPGSGDYGSVSSGKTVDVLAKHMNNYYKVSTGSKIGYIKCNNITLSNEASSKKNVPNYALNQMNKSGETSGTASPLEGVTDSGSNNNNNNTDNVETQIEPNDEEKVEIDTSYKLFDNPSLKVSGDITSLATNASLMSEPNENSKIIGIANKGTQCTVSDTKGDWYKVSLNGSEGWVEKQYINNPKGKEDNDD